MKGITPEEVNKETLRRIAEYLKKEEEDLVRILEEIENKMISTRRYDEIRPLFRKREIMLRVFASVRETAIQLYHILGLTYEENESKKDIVERYKRMHDEIKIF
jgi:hypothetical protein